MSKKYNVVFGLMVGALMHAQAYANPASTEYVRSAIDGLRTELNGQSNAQFNQLTALTNQLNAKIEHLSNSVNQLTIQLNQTITQTQSQDSQANGRIDEVQQKIDALPIVTHQVGEMFQGGMVFYVDATQQHGLIVSLTDLGQPIEWRNGEGGDRVTNAQGQGLGSGETNTRLVISEQTIDQQDGDFAALRAANYAVLADGTTPCPATLTASQTCYGGWYLPSVYELVLLHSALKPLGLAALQDAPYWSSTELNTTQALSVDFLSGELKVHDKAFASAVRAIHSF